MNKTHRSKYMLKKSFSTPCHFIWDILKLAIWLYCKFLPLAVEILYDYWSTPRNIRWYSDGGGDRWSPPWRFTERGDQLHPQVGRQQGAWPQVCRLYHLTREWIFPSKKQFLVGLQFWLFQVIGKSGSSLQRALPCCQGSGHLETCLCKGWYSTSFKRNLSFSKVSLPAPNWWPR